MPVRCQLVFLHDRTDLASARQDLGTEALKQARKEIGAMRAVKMVFIALALARCGAEAAAGEAAVMPQSGRLYILTGAASLTAVVMTSQREKYEGELYLWRQEQHLGESGGFYQHVPLEGQVSVDSLSWSPDGKALVFCEHVSGAERLCYLRSPGMEVLEVFELARDGVHYKAWSPNSRYLAFVQRGEGGDRVRCFPENFRPLNLTMRLARPDLADDVFDLPAPKGRTIRDLRWAPDSSKLLGCAYVVEPEESGKEERASKPALFVTSPGFPGARSHKIVWSDDELKDFTLQAEWAAGGNLILFSLGRESGCGGPGPFYAVKPDGGSLRILWKPYEVMDFELSPDGQRALLWILETYHGGNHPEPNRMAAVNIATGTTKLLERGMIALAPHSISDGVEQSIEWGKNGRSVSLFVRLANRPGARRVTFALP